MSNLSLTCPSCRADKLASVEKLTSISFEDLSHHGHECNHVTISIKMY